MKIAEVRALGTPDLNKRLGESRRELFNLRVRHVSRQLVSTAELGKVKQRIARLETVLRERELGLEKG